MVRVVIPFAYKLRILLSNAGVRVWRFLIICGQTHFDGREVC